MCCNPCVNLKLLVMVGQTFVMVGQTPAHAHPWLRTWSAKQVSGDEKLVTELGHTITSRVGLVYKELCTGTDG